MHRVITVFSGVLVATTGLFLSVTSASAQAPETWVSDGGLGGNDCLSVAAPCRSFGGANGALAKTVAGGLIHVLPGSYGGFTIDKSIDIIADQGQAAITTSLALNGSFVAGISVETAATDIVRLRGFQIAATPAVAPPAGGIGGIMLQSAGVLHIENCTFVRGDSGYGIVFAPTGVGELYVSNSTLSDNGGPSTGGGLLIKPSGSGSAKVVLDNTRVENNLGGMLIDGNATTGSNTVTVRDSVLADNLHFGFNVIDTSGGTSVMIEGSSVTSSPVGVRAQGAAAIVRMRNSTVTGHTTGLRVVSSGQIISNGGNVVTGNTSNGAFTQTVAQQ